MAKRKKKSGSKKIPAFQKYSSLALAAAIVIFAIWLQNHPAQKGKVEKPAPAKRPPVVKIQPKPAPTASLAPVEQPFKRVETPPPARTKRPLSSAPAIVFVIDDMGNTSKYTEQLIQLGDDVTYAILPLLRHSAKFAHLSLKTHAEVILHLPLESAKGTIPGPGLITNAMSDQYVLEELQRNLVSVPYRAGVNNHMGSSGTANRRLMKLILTDLKKRRLFFLDSKTSAKSVAPEIAKALGVPYLKRDEFLDNVDSLPAVKDRIRETAALAQRQGYAIAIGHYRPNTLQALLEEIPRLKREGFQIVSLQDLL